MRAGFLLNTMLYLKRKKVTVFARYPHTAVQTIDKARIERFFSCRTHGDGESYAAVVGGIYDRAFVFGKVAFGDFGSGIIHRIFGFGTFFVRNFLGRIEVLRNAARIGPYKPARAQLYTAEIARNHHRGLHKFFGL